MKYLITLLLFVGIFHVTRASAQCAAGIPSAGNPECLPPDDANSPYYQGDGSQQPVQPQQQPRAVWATRWGAIVIDDDTGQAGMVVNYASKSEAVDAAMHDCQEHGSPHCQVELVYHNQCAAIAQGGNSHLSAGGPTRENAEAYALDKCKQGAKTNCTIYYTGCSLPVRVQ